MKTCNWQASGSLPAFLRLNVYRDNQAAIAAYEKIGFDTDLHEAVMTLNRGEFNALRVKQ